MGTQTEHNLQVVGVKFDELTEEALVDVNGGGLGKSILGGAAAGAFTGLATGGPAGAFVGAHLGASASAIQWMFNH